MKTEQQLENYTLSQRIEILKLVKTELSEDLRKRAQERQRQVEVGEIDDSPTEKIEFDNVELEVNPNPSIYLIDYNFQKLTGPRLELHLRGPIGLHRARLQMGRIARYVEARHLEEEFTDISAITYPQLASGALRITRMVPTLLTYVPHTISPDAYARGEGTFKSANNFLARHNRPLVPAGNFTFDSQSLPTNTFLEHWRDFGVEEEAT